MARSAVEALGLQGVELLGDKGSKRVSADEALAGKTLGLYFSAHWCPPCKAFTPLLARVYKTLREKNSDFEVVFVSGDKSEAQAEEYFQQMPWLAIPFEEHEVRSALSGRFSVMGIPRLVIVGPDGETIASDARVAVQNDEAGEQYPWRGASTSGQALLGLMLSPRGLLMMFIIGYYLLQWLGFIGK